jgi:acetolactate synthase I/II/III large subunit
VNVAEAVGRTLSSLGVERAFGVVGSGNFHVTNALVAGGVEFVAARHEGGAATMADGYSRTADKVSVLTVHQGCGLTNALTGLTEAAKSRTPLLVIAAEATSARSNFYVDQPGLARSVGIISDRVSCASSAVQDAARAFRLARDERRTVLLNLPLDIQTLEVPEAPEPVVTKPRPPERDVGDCRALVDALSRAKRPVFIAGRGARSAGARTAIMNLAGLTGALLSTSAVAKGLFQGVPWSLDVSGGFATPLASELIRSADLIVAWGCSLNMWTTRHGALISGGTVVAQVELEEDALGANHRIDVGIVGDVTEVAVKVAGVLHEAQHVASGYRDDALASRILAGGRWRDVPYLDEGVDGFIDPRTLTIALDDIFPEERVIAIDSGNFMGYPIMFLGVPDFKGMCFTQSFQSIGLGLATAVGAALARPDYLPVAALGDGGALMGIAELETVVRLGLTMVIVIYNDAAYGAEVHHFAPGGYPLDTVVFPETDFASIGRGFGCDAVTVRKVGDLSFVREWLGGARMGRPLVIDAKVTRSRASWWLEDAFRGH